MKFFALLSAFLLLFAGLLPAQSSSKSSVAPIDMEKARALLVKKRKGGALTADAKELKSGATPKSVNKVMTTFIEKAN